jgi:hypothetical protein
VPLFILLFKLINSPIGVTVTEEERERVTQIEDRVAAATPGPWDSGSRVRGTQTNVVTGPDALEIVVRKPGSFFRDYKDDADFVAHARKDVPWLIELVKRLEDENRQLRSSITGGK